MLRLNSKKMLMLDNGKPFAITLNVANSTGTLNCNFYLPFAWCGYEPDSIYLRVNEISFDVILPAGNGMVAVYKNYAQTMLVENLSAGTHRITYNPNGDRYDWIGVFCDKGGNNTITITNIVMK